MNIGDRVVIVKSPYHSVKNGTAASVKDIKYSQFGKRWQIYVLDTGACSSFREDEIKIVDGDK